MNFIVIKRIIKYQYNKYTIKMNKYEQRLIDTILYNNVQEKELKNIIERDIKNINIDNITSISKNICMFHQNDYIVPVFNYLFESNIKDNIIYDKIEYIYINACHYNNIDILKSIIFYCFKYNYKFNIHSCDDDAFFCACYNGSVDMIQYLITINKKYYYSLWSKVIVLDNQIDKLDEFYNSIRYIFHTKQIQYKSKSKKKCYIFNNNIDTINNFYFDIFKKAYISYIIYLNI